MKEDDAGRTRKGEGTLYRKKGWKRRKYEVK